jgi:hypothetical protein
MGRILLTTAAVAALGGVLAVAATGRPNSGGTPADRAAFRLSDSSAGCGFADGRIACRTESMRAAAVLESDGDSRAADVRVAWDEDTPVLRTTESWWHAGFSCRVANGDLVCVSLSGGKIAVDAAG